MLPMCKRVGMGINNIESKRTATLMHAVLFDPTIQQKRQMRN